MQRRNEDIPTFVRICDKRLLSVTEFCAYSSAGRNKAMELAEAAGAYSDYCNDSSTRINTDIRKAEILEKCLAGVTCCQMAEEYGCCEGTIYSDMRENAKRLAAMMFK